MWSDTSRLCYGATQHKHQGKQIRFLSTWLGLPMRRKHRGFDINLDDTVIDYDWMSSIYKKCYNKSNYLRIKEKKYMAREEALARVSSGTGFHYIDTQYRCFIVVNGLFI